jgi:hypothetical protein
MPELLTVEIPEQQYRELLQALEPKQARQATFAAVKRATESGASFMASLVRKRTTLAREEAAKVIKANVPSGDPPVGRITIKQKLIPLSKFKFASLSRGGVSVKIDKDRPPLRLSHAFIATMKSGHQGVYLRAKHLPTKGPNIGKGRLTPQGFAGRFAIAEQFGPSVLQFISDPAVFKDVQDHIQTVLVRRAASQLARFSGVSSFERDSAEIGEIGGD